MLKIKIMDRKLIDMGPYQDKFTLINGRLKTKGRSNKKRTLFAKSEKIVQAYGLKVGQVNRSPDGSAIYILIHINENSPQNEYIHLTDPSRRRDYKFPYSEKAGATTEVIHDEELIKALLANWLNPNREFIGARRDLSQRLAKALAERNDGMLEYFESYCEERGIVVRKEQSGGYSEPESPTTSGGSSNLHDLKPEEEGKRKTTGSGAANSSNDISSDEWAPSDVPVPENALKPSSPTFKGKDEIKHQEKRINQAAIGLAGERYVVDRENERLSAAGYEDKKAVRLETDGDGYDVLSFDIENNRPLHIEVKTTSKGKFEPFHISHTEYLYSKEKTDAYTYRLYRLYDFEWIDEEKKTCKAAHYILEGDLDDCCEKIDTAYKMQPKSKSAPSSSDA